MSGTMCRVCAAPTDGFACRPCWRAVERVVAEAPSLLHELGNVITRQTRVYRTSGPQRPPEPRSDPEAHIPAHLRTRDGRIALRPSTVPVNLDATELLWVAWNTYGTWARIIAEHRGSVDDWPTSENLLQWLLGHVESLRWQDDAAEAYDELVAIHRDLERAVDRSPERYYAGPCSADECERDLYAWPGKDEITCDGWRSDGIGCRAAYTTAERREWLYASVCEYNVNLRDLCDAAPTLLGIRVEWETVRKWPRERKAGKRVIPPRLKPVGEAHGEPLYRGSEIVKLMLDEDTRSGAKRAS